MDKCVKRLGMGITSGKAAKAVENQRARKLYEEIFDEDSPAFVDYYFRVKAAENEIFVVENEKQEILATLHLNPYEMMFCGERVKTNYIVAVATRADCRHQGMMRSLLQASLQEMYRREETFTWLMPAAEAIYRPFGFRFIYEKNKMTVTADVLRRAETDEKWQIHSDQEVSGDIFCEEAKKEDLAELACFAEKQLSKLAEVYTVHDIAYFEQRMQEVECEGGSLILIRKEKEICGYFLALKKDREAWEIVVEDAVQKKAFPAVLHWFGESKEKCTFTAFPQIWEQYAQSENVPAIMGRIVHLERFVCCLKIKKEQEWKIRLTDSLIPENNGYFIIKTGIEGGSLIRVENLSEKEKKMFCSMDIGQLTEELFRLPVFLNEVV
ncbi:GNAT family N-acetyltransferase [Faecalicatena fissicatena]|uniref:GNAT family N-acetyltransferase n=1 Tax=Faecalicatena fissicatena TaxID=290055 RepID=A0ABX2GZ00_9FIRM|nr:GNAT family N-acetyltransferase [Faecalicatena fissicatena]MCB5868196.1 GNAT family N-acetyltransferase [Faecalicatena fissicatena]NSD83329.1 GNAT family N-acetyltransferase [Faecalicatena fissicatena]NSE55927.1 GNAT family N-acetyltransferase [Faecalicatena fissicatena]NSE64687.1 GNAT family N-acetyltransferase [Faecalicatena fissicatena]NSG30835.1 GNAT family N-acetyltransferase [Faecalicatena fissicatena]